MWVKDKYLFKNVINADDFLPRSYSEHCAQHIFHESGRRDLKTKPICSLV